MAFAPKPAIEKLPLAVRKDLKDNYDTQKGELETKIATLLGVESFHSNLNPNHIWAYNTDDRSSAGGTLYRYLEGFHDAVKYYIDKYGETGKEHFNDAVSQREVVAVVNELGDKASYIDADIKDGVFRILFRWDSLGSNSSYLTDYLLKAVDSVPREGLGVAAKWSVDEYWEPRKAELTQQLEEITGLTGLQLEPNFDQLYKELTAVEEDDRWRDSLGEGVYNYFNDGLKYQLERQGFKGDEMMHEGIAEVATAKKFGLRVVKETKKKGAYNEIVIEDGEIWIQFTPQNWRTNVGDAGAGLIDLL